MASSDNGRQPDDPMDRSSDHDFDNGCRLFERRLINKPPHVIQRNIRHR